MARRVKAGMVINNDAHAPGDLVSAEMRRKVALGAGMTEEEAGLCEENARRIIQDRISP
jgi:histidinol phosphatase-like PHP family hydrolase